MKFKWDEQKAAANLRNHGVSFELAKSVFRDPFGIERLDDREDYGEDRFILVGMADGAILLFVVYTERADCIRLISAREVTQREEDDYFQQNS